MNSAIAETFIGFFRSALRVRNSRGGAFEIKIDN
jgi:hypothetical protein